MYISTDSHLIFTSVQLQALPAVGHDAGDHLDGLSKSAYERRISRLEDEKKELLRKLADSNRALQNFAHGLKQTFCKLYQNHVARLR